MKKENKKEELISIKDSKIALRNDIKEEDVCLVPEKISWYKFPAFTNDVVLDINEKKHIALTGHTGVGKTSLIKEIAARINQPVIRVNLNGQTTISDFVGFWSVKGSEMVWVDGSLPLAMKNGYWIILDEIDFAEAFILATLNSVLEINGVLTLKEKGHEVIVPHNNFRIFATANTIGCMEEYRGMYQGTNILNEAFLDRWRVYYVNYLSQEDESQVIADCIPRMKIEITKTLVKVATMIREAFDKGTINCTFSTRRLIDWAEMMVRHRHPIEAAENTIFSKVSRDDSKVIKGIIQRTTKMPEDE